MAPHSAQVPLRSGWQVVSFRARRQDWRIGHNDFVLSFAYAWPEGADNARAVRIARVTIAPLTSAVKIARVTIAPVTSQ